MGHGVSCPHVYHTTANPMSKRPEYIQLAANEDVNSIRDRLTFIRGTRVLLIWPEHGTALTRKLDLVLVQREAKRRAIQIALVTHDEQVAQHAADLGISTFETIGGSERTRWKRGRSRLFTSRDDRPEDAPEPEELMEVASRVKNQKRVAWWRSLLSRSAILLILILVMGATAYIVVPSATVTIQLSQDILESEVNLTADPNARDVNIEARVIPATILRATVQSSGTVETTGSESLPDTPAVGVVVFTNQTFDALTIPAGTTVSTTTGSPIYFRTMEEKRVRGGTDQTVEVPIQAVEGSTGAQGNVDIGMINTVVGELASQVSVINLTPTRGGESRSFRLVTQEDRDSLMATVNGQIQAAAYDEMQQTLTDSQTIVIETVRISPTGQRKDWVTFSHEVGVASNTLSLDMRATVEALAIDDRFAKQIVLADLAARQPAGLLLLPESFQYFRGSVIETRTDGTVVLSASGQGIVKGELNAVQVQEAIAGKSPQEATAIIARMVNLSSGAAPQIVLDPDWLPHLPLLPVRIQIMSQ
jgi:hypothetical protein